MALKPFNIEAGDIPRYTYEDYKLWEGDWELIKGYPYAMSPSPKRKHQQYGKNFVAATENLLKSKSVKCNCNVYYELDWVISNDTVVCPDLMIVSGNFETDFLTFPPRTHCGNWQR
ncbi:MAG: Uma2 family endonuclease [Chitinophagaceae bacterium]|nr:Uma2 family endonuclease [Chitinophagaceae bacterium]